MSDRPIVVIVLAGQRAGVVNPLAAAAGVTHKCFVPIAGRPLIEHVLEALADVPDVGEILVSAEPEAFAELDRLIAPFVERGTAIRLVPSRTNLVDSVLAAAGAEPGPFIVTTADNVLVTPAAVAQVRGALGQTEAVFAFARREDVLAAHPEAQRGFYRFRDGEFANCNIYGLANRRALERGAEIFRGGGQFMRSVWRMMAAFGWHNIVLLKLGVFDLRAAVRRISRRIGVDVKVTEFADGSLAVDVDNQRTYRVCEAILAQRGAR